MFVLTVDQVNSRTAADAVDDALAVVRHAGGGRLARPAERTVGDEVQLATADARCVLDIVLGLDRLGGWSIGCGAGAVDEPLPRSVRAARGPAFLAAREAITAAKRRPTRFALRGPDVEAAADAQALLDLLLAMRARRSEEGWEVFDLMSSGEAQTAIADRLGISKQAVSLRARAAQIATEQAAIPALARVLERTDRATGPGR